ncbi:hypothetical protein [Pontibacter kalidii]|uniref:hypothetical protein n=1 Tax=Pontibacter kalidii TaxID=2592049 RepID=UPI002259ED79|nr:hypothetical protein [Pontibacter kalidii]
MTSLKKYKPFVLLLLRYLPDGDGSEWFILLRRLHAGGASFKYSTQSISFILPAF